MPEALFSDAFSLWGAPTTWLELVAFVLALAMVGFNIREVHWGWPLAIVSSVLYCALFWRSRLYGDAGLQIFFAVIALWGWVQWLRGTRSTDGTGSEPAMPPPLAIARLAPQHRWHTLAACAALWPAIGLFLKHFTDTDVPWWDAFPTALSIVGQVLLGRKYIENWLVWIAVNIVSVGLFAYKGLWLTALLYTLFIALSVAGWRAWQRRI